VSICRVKIKLFRLIVKTKNQAKSGKLMQNWTSSSKLLTLASGAVILTLATPNSSFAFELTRTFLNPNQNVQDQFGASIAISGNDILIGDPGDRIETNCEATVFQAVV
jgi:hypothetical protein